MMQAVWPTEYPDIPKHLISVRSGRSRHRYLAKAVECYYLWRYSREAVGRTGQRGDARDQKVRRFLRDYKAPSDDHRRSRKYLAIEHAAAALGATIPSSWLAGCCLFVPMPPSRSSDDPAYDARVLATLMAVSPPIAIGNILRQTRNTTALTKGLAPWVRAERLRCGSVPVETSVVIIVDDMLTSGAHFRAAEMVIRSMKREVAVCGLFLTRRC